MYAQLGNIEFEPITGFSEFTSKRETVMAQHDRINSKAKLQNTGEKLDEITIKLKLHFLFTVPEDRIAEFQDARQSGEILPLVWGNGVFLGNFVITTISTTIQQNDDFGNIKEAELDIALIESVIDDPAAQLEAEARKRGFANVANGASPRLGAFGTLSDAQKASLLLAASESQAQKLNANNKEIEKNSKTRSQKFKDNIKRLDAITSAIQLAQNIIFGNEGLLLRSDILLTNMRGTLRAVAKLKSVSQAQDLGELNQANQDLATASRRTSGSSQSIASLSATRKKP
jgi:phage protein U